MTENRDEYAQACSVRTADPVTGIPRPTCGTGALCASDVIPDMQKHQDKPVWHWYAISTLLEWDPHSNTMPVPPFPRLGAQWNHPPDQFPTRP